VLFVRLLDTVLRAPSEQKLGTELELASTIQTIPRSDIIQHAILDVLTQNLSPLRGYGEQNQALRTGCRGRDDDRQTSGGYYVRAEMI
jgi:hypothetical protein